MVQASFEDFFLVEMEPMVRLATSLVDARERAEEIVQDAFEKTYLAWHRIDAPGAYLRRAVVNGCRSELRRRRIVRRADSHPSFVSPVADDICLLDALARLTPRRRIALVLRFYVDLPVAEIALLMQVRVGTAKSLVSRGLADLRKVVSNESDQ